MDLDEGKLCFQGALRVTGPAVEQSPIGRRARRLTPWARGIIGNHRWFLEDWDNCLLGLCFKTFVG